MSLSNVSLFFVTLATDSWESCELVMATAITLLWISRYLVVAITCVRLISISDPLRFNSRVTPHRAVVSIILVVSLNIAAGLAFLARPGPCE